MVTNKLHLNNDQTEFLAICAPLLCVGVTVSSLTVGSPQIATSSAARKLGVIMNQTLNRDTCVQRLCQTAMIHLKNIADITRCLSHDVAENLIHAFVTSRLNYSNGLLFGMSAASLRKLQNVQNTRILTGSPKYDHITPVLCQLHWLAMEYRVQYKILLVTYRAQQGQARVTSRICCNFKPLAVHFGLPHEMTYMSHKENWGHLGTELSQLQLQIPGTPCLPISDSHRHLQFFKKQLKVHLYRLAF